MITKTDIHLAKVLAMPEIKKLDCLVYGKNLDFLEKKLVAEGAKITGRFPFIGALGISAQPQNLKNILKLEEAEFLCSHTKVFAMMNVARQILGVENTFGGKNTTIAYIDTGLSPHLDFVLGDDRIVKFVDFINHKVFPYDDNGHGTFVAGVGSGSGAVSNKKFAGIAPKSNIIGLKALDASGEANATKILEAMQWIYENATRYNIKVVCMSFGSEPLGAHDPIMQGAEALWNKGIIVVAAAGNSGPEYSTIKSPGVSPQIITVGAFDDNRLENATFDPTFFEIAQFSSRGPAFDKFKPDLVAPAVDITSCGIEKNYTTLSGTSVACPMIAGICALLLEQNPKFSPSEIKSKLLSLCKPITFNQNKEGSGYFSFNNKITP